jgi:hypothetical protein
MAPVRGGLYVLWADGVWRDRERQERQERQEDLKKWAKKKASLAEGLSFFMRYVGYVDFSLRDTSEAGHKRSGTQAKRDTSEAGHNEEEEDEGLQVELERERVREEDVLVIRDGGFVVVGRQVARPDKLARVREVWLIGHHVVGR